MLKTKFRGKIRLLRISILVFTVMLQLAFCWTPAFSRSSTEYIAGTYLGQPWISSPLAENSSPGFDCTTYVEKVLSERHENPDAALDLIRYRDGMAGFFNRNHFMEEMWIPNAQKHGFIAAVTLPGAAKSLMKVDLAEWYRSNPEIIQKDEAYYHAANSHKRFSASISYVPAGLIDEKLLEALPGEVVVFIMKRYPKPPYRWLLNKNAVMVTHMGLLFGGCHMYHASSLRKEVIMEDFLGYLRANRSVYGVAFYEITDQNSL